MNSKTIATNHQQTPTMSYRVAWKVGTRPAVIVEHPTYESANHHRAQLLLAAEALRLNDCASIILTEVKA